MSHNPRLTLSNITTSTGSATDERMDFSYDGTLVTSISQSGILNENISYTYNNDFLPTSMTYANQTENYTYNADNEAVSIGNYTITRQKKNRVIKVSDGIYTHISKYNRYGELKHQRDNALRVRLFRNKAGQIVRKVEKLKGDRKKVYRYSYDERGRLTQVKERRNIIESYTYDANGNRASAKVYGTTITASYTLDDNLVTYGQNSYLYDEDGYLKTKTTPSGTTTYSYGTRGELLSVTTPTKTITYKQNANNQRVSKLINNIVVEKYLWANLTTLLAVYDKDDNLLQRFEYIDKRMPISMTNRNGTKYYLHYDQVGSLRIVSDTNHNIIKEIVYDTYGNILSDSNETFIVPFGFAGGLYDSDTKLTRFGYRDYDAYTGKWTAKDPIGFLGGDSNLYGYVNYNPVNSIDSKGLLIRPSPIDILYADYFALHYFLGNKKPLDLNKNLDLGNRFRHTASVQNAINDFKNRINSDLCKPCYSEKNIYDSTITDVTWDEGLFSVGRSTFYQEAVCKNGKWNYHFYIRDWFRQPLVTGSINIYEGEIYGGDPYKIIWDLYE